MIEYVIEESIDKRSLKKAVDILNSGGLVAYPTDSSWSLGCSAFSSSGLDKLKKLKGKEPFVPTLLCSEISQISEFVQLQNGPFKIIKKLIPGPYVFILEPHHFLEKKMGIKRLELGIRIPSHKVPRALIDLLGHPLFSITASKKMTEEGWWDSVFAEENLFEYGYEVEDIPSIQMVLDTGEPLPKYLTTVISLKDDTPELLRQGIGIWE